MAQRRKPRAFSLEFRGKPAVILDEGEWAQLGGTGKGAIRSVVRTETAPVDTVVWLRYHTYHSMGRDTGSARWQALARVTKSEIVKEGTQSTFPKYRTTFVVIDQPEMGRR